MQISETKDKKLPRQRYPLRKRAVPDEVAELLSVANQLPRTLDGTHQSVLNSRALGADETGTRYFLQRANERLPAALQVFVKPNDSQLENGAEGWKKALGPLLFACALGASGGLLLPSPLSARELESRNALEASGQISFPQKGKPFFGLGEVEAMRQRYFFLFAVRDLLEAISGAHISLDEARHLLEPLAQLEAFRGRFDIGKKNRKNKTHNLGYAKPNITWVLEKIEVERIRKCSICERLFWAGRLDQSACRSQCSNVLRARTWREKYGPGNSQRKRKAAGASESKTKDQERKER